MVFDYRWNFRSRGSHYQIDIPAFPDFKYKKYYSEFPSAGYISHEEAWKFIENAFELLKKEYKLF